MYSFDTDKEAAMISYNLVREAYRRIFHLLEQPIVEGNHFVSSFHSFHLILSLIFPVQAPTGLIGGDLSHEFHVTAPIGEDTVITCPRYVHIINTQMLCI